MDLLSNPRLKWVQASQPVCHSGGEQRVRAWSIPRRPKPATCCVPRKCSVLSSVSSLMYNNCCTTVTDCQSCRKRKNREGRLEPEKRTRTFNALLDLYSLKLGESTNYTSIVNLDGGVIACTHIASRATNSTQATSILNLNGGTIRAKGVVGGIIGGYGSGTISYLTTVNVKSGRAIIRGSVDQEPALCDRLVHGDADRPVQFCFTAATVACQIRHSRTPGLPELRFRHTDYDTIESAPLGFFASQ